MGEQIQQIQRLHLAGTLAAGIAHDLNNELTILLGNIQLAASQLPHAHRALKSIELARTAAAHCADMSRRLLNVGRQTPPVITRVDVAAAILEARHMLQCIKPRPVALTTYADDGLFVYGDHTQIQQILINLGTNAFHAMPSGGELQIRAWKDVDIRIAIRDTGCGIPDEIRDRVFDPFFTTRAESGGSGLGLATVRSIIEGMGGYVDVESSSENGTTFLLTLPAAWTTLQ